MLDFVTALGLVFVIEGVIYALFPDAMKRMIVSILALPPEQLRAFGLVMAVFGVFVVWLVRG